MVTVGASVEPYVRLTVQSNASVASSTNADVTPAPPLEMSRSDATRSRENPEWAIRSTKKVGGPIMNVMRSRSMRRSACSGSHRAMNTARMRDARGRRHPLSRPEMCASGAGISTASSGPSP